MRKSRSGAGQPAPSRQAPIPPGTRDVLPDEMRELRAISARVRGTFEHAGYRIGARLGHQLVVGDDPAHQAERQRSGARNLRAEHSRSIAAGKPTRRGSSQLTPCSAIRPRWAKAVVNTADSEAKRRSAVERDDEADRRRGR